MDVPWTILHVLMLIILEDDKNNVTSKDMWGDTRRQHILLLNEWMNIYVLASRLLLFIIQEKWKFKMTVMVMDRRM